MLTCKVGNSIINCFDGKYDKYTLKKWDEEKRLICPDCDKLYEYCHGEIVPPYFRHKEKSKECEGIYFEPETEEHIEGKMILYNWLISLQKQNIVSNVKLESYIPETRQRPDLYFEKDNLKFVIEFQCSPIATEYIERHKLYQLASIHDIWILGTNKYNIHILDNYAQIYLKKFLEKECNFYLNVKDSLIYINTFLIREKLLHKLLFLKESIGFNLESFDIDDNLFLKDEIIEKFQKEDNEIFNNTECTFIKSIPQDNIFKKVVKYIDREFKKIDSDYDIRLDKYPEYEYYDYYWNFKKRRGQRVLHYTYKICLYHKKYKNGWENFSNIVLTNKLYEINDKLELIKYIRNTFENSSISIYCKDCKSYFNFTLKELEFYIKNDFELPKRCKKCRNIRKQYRRA